MRPLMILALLLFQGASLQAEELSGTLQKAKETRRIVIGFQEGSVPFSYLGADQKPVGFALDICLRIVDDVKQRLNLPDLRVEYMPVTSSTRIPLLVNGTIDLNCASATNNAERQKQVAFTNTDFLSATRFAAKKASNIRGFDDLKRRTVVSVSGSTNLGYLLKANTERGLGMKIVAVSDQLEAFLMLETDRAQAYVLDDIQLAVAIARSKDPSAYMIGSDALSRPEPFGIMLRKGDAPFKEIADRATAELYESDRLDALYRKWFESPIPPNGINFNYPMTPELRRAFKHPSSSADPDDYAKG